MSNCSSVLSGCSNESVFIRVLGKGSFQNSAPVKDLIRQMLQRGFNKFIIDLSSCEQMDSTFMGTLAGAALRLKENGNGRLAIIHANTRNRHLLQGLGLDQVIEVHDGSGGYQFPSQPEALTPVEINPETDQRKVVLEAHENLVSTNPSNATKFSDVFEFLRQNPNSNQNNPSQPEEK